MCQVTAPDGASVLDAARRAGRDIPALCHHEAVPAIASCRLCLVEVRRPGRDWVQLTTSCDYPVSAGLVVVTDSPRIRKHRGHEPAASAATCPGRPGPPAARLAARRDGAAVRSRHGRAASRLHPLRALRARLLRPGLQRAVGDRPRRAQAASGPPFGQTAAQDCVGCGSCVEACPTECIPMEDTADHAHDLGPHLRTPDLRALRQTDHDQSARRGDGRRGRAAGQERATLRCLQEARHERAPRFAGR